MTAIDLEHYRPVNDELRERVILVTGAGDGIGRAVALALAAHGATVILSGRTVRKLEAVHDQILAAKGPQPSIAPLNLERALANDYDAVAAAIESNYGRLDGLLHNAAMLGQLRPIDHYEVPVWVRVLHVNVTAEFALTQVCLPLLRQSPDASVLFTSSSVGRRGRALWGAYSVSKFAVEGLAQVLADELASTSIRVNAQSGACTQRHATEAYPAEDRSPLPVLRISSVRICI